VQERTKTGPRVDHYRTDEMTLHPPRPPGRSTRKARAFHAEIGQLRAQGYTFEAIREALAAAGVMVSKSTVQREAARHATRAACVHPRAATQAPAAPIDTPVRPGLRSGKDLAEDFVRSRITNPLLRTREQR
jgi:hypothetical protein